MVLRLHRFRWVVGLLVIVLAGLTVAAAYAAPNAAPAAQGSTCNWRSIGNANKASYYAAAAMDTVADHMYIYGGLDQSQATLDTVQRIDLSGTSITPAPHSIVTGVSALKRFGAAGAFRVHGNDTAAFFIGGADSVRRGVGSDDVQVYDTKNKSWKKITTSGTFEDRLLHAAAYDPVHDVIWVTGGIAKCGLDDIANNRCTARTFPTKYLEFDDAAGTATWHQLSGSGPNQLYGHTMVYDENGKRMILFGGSRDGRQGSNNVWILDLSDADVTKAKWAQVSAGGVTVPKLALHGAAFDSARNMLVVYGGVTTNFNMPNENTSSATFALDVTKNPPVWSNLGVSIQERVGPAMAYAPLHQVVVINGGRRRAHVPPPQDVQRSSHALSCADQPTQIPPPSTAQPSPTTPPTVLPSPPTPMITATPARPTQPTPGGDVQVCSFIQRFNRIPPAVISAALANPDTVYGYNLRCNPSVPASLANRPRRYLSIHDTARPWHPLYNSLEMKCGCP
jgi:hypothetical protein